MPVTAAHLLVYTAHADQVRAALRDVLGWPHVDAGDGWLIFRLPPAEVGVHPADPGSQTRLELAFICDDLAATLDELRGRGATDVGEVQEHGWGTGASVTLAPGLQVLVYQPTHATAVQPG